MEGSSKERLTGAVIFVAALIIVLSETFSGPDSGSASAELANKPAEAGPPLRTYSVTLDGSAKPEDVAPAVPVAETPMPVAPVIEPPVPAPPVVAVPAAPVAPVSVERAAVVTKTPPPAESSDAAAGGKWWLQVGIFASRDNAERLAQKLRAAGFAVDLEKYAAGGKDMLRVRAGPVRDRAEALALQARLKAAGSDSHLLPP